MPPPTKRVRRAVSVLMNRKLPIIAKGTEPAANQPATFQFIQ